jgi:hypothetical protein
LVGVIVAIMLAMYMRLGGILYGGHAAPTAP